LIVVAAADYSVDLLPPTSASGNSESGIFGGGSTTEHSSYMNFPSLLPSVLRQAVCIALKYSSNDRNDKRRRSIRLR
jgi:hypothetical protein